MNYNLKRAVTANIGFIWFFSFFLSLTAYINGGLAYGLKALVATLATAIIATVVNLLPVSIIFKSEFVIFLPFFASLGLSIVNGGVARMFNIYILALVMRRFTLTINGCSLLGRSSMWYSSQSIS